MGMLRVGIIMYQTSLSKGQELVAQRMTRELIQQGHEAVLITSKYHDFQPIFTSQELASSGGYVLYHDEDLGIPVVRVDSHKVDWPPRRINFRNFTSILHKLVDEFNLNILVTHSTLWNGPDLTAQFVAWQRHLSAQKSSREKLLFCHMSHFQSPQTERYSMRERTYREVWNEYSLTRIIKEANLLLVVSPETRDHMIHFGARPNQCMLFPGGIIVPQTKSKNEKTNFRNAYGIPPEDKIVAFLGTVEERKNALQITEVAQALKDKPGITFVIAGRLEGEYGNRVASKASELKNLHVIGEISEDAKATLISTSYLNLTLSKVEALGLAQLEFMSAGVPVITSGVGGQSWIVRNGETGVILEGSNDIAGAASAIEKMVVDLAYHKQLSKKAKEFAAGFSMSSLVRKLVERLTTKLHAN